MAEIGCITPSNCLNHGDCAARIWVTAASYSPPELTLKDSGSVISVGKTESLTLYNPNTNGMSECGISSSSSLTGVHVQSFVDRVLLQPGTVLTGDGRYYSVFSPFKKRWLSIYQENNQLPYQLPSTTRSPVETLQWSSLCEAPESDLSAFATDERQIQIDLNEFY